MSGQLYVISTPIGNLEDITLRAIRILGEVDEIICEDTRHTLKLLNHYHIKKPLMSCHSYNERKQTERIIAKLQSGINMAMVSDAGTPCISDPGSWMIAQIRQTDIPVIPIPGASAWLTLVSVSGLTVNMFHFFGFLPIKRSKRLKKWMELIKYPGVVGLYESPHRILKLMDELVDLIPNHRVIVGREMTKKYEQFYYGSSLEVANQIKQERPRGEYVILIDTQLKQFTD